MNDQQRRRQLAELLGRLVAAGEMTQEQATAVYLATMDDGTLLDEALPLPPYLGMQRQPPADDDTIRLIAAIAGIAILSNATLGERQRIDAADLLQEYHAAAAVEIANALALQQLSVAEFQRRMIALNEEHNAAQIALGAAENRRQFAPTLDSQATIQAGYLQRFADVTSAGILSDAAGMEGARRPFSANYLAQRAAQYGGIGRALFFQAYEALGLPRLANGNAPGIVIRYIAMDDAGTCSPCHRAQGYYLPGAGPFPGQICLGRQNCRCRRITVYDPARYAALIGAIPPL